MTDRIEEMLQHEMLARLVEKKAFPERKVSVFDERDGNMYYHEGRRYYAEDYLDAFIFGINVRRHPEKDLFLFNYRQTMKLNNNLGLTRLLRREPLFQLMRGLVVDSKGNYVALAFPRFFNHNEEEGRHVDFDWERAWIETKFDGTLLNVFYYRGDWVFATRNKIPADVDFIDGFLTALDVSLDQLDDLLSKRFTYAFEVMFPHWSRHSLVTRYDKHQTALLTMRVAGQNESYRTEITKAKTLDGVAGMIGALRPRRIPVDNINYALELLGDLEKDEEGFVARDANGNRLKIKKEEFFLLSKVRQQSGFEMFEAILRDLADGSRDFYEIVHTNFGDAVKRRYAEVETLVGVMYEKAVQAFKEGVIQKNQAPVEEQRKAFALAVEGSPFSKILFDFLGDAEKEASTGFTLQDFARKMLCLRQKYRKRVFGLFSAEKQLGYL